jgi:glucans biosynthesis protein
VSAPRPGDESAAGDVAAEPVCGARTRKGGRCLRRPARGFVRCRWHGGHDRIGAPKANRNAVKHGLFTAEEIARRREINEFIRACWRTLREMG